MRLGNFREGLEILTRYFNDPDGYHIGAEHDQIYIYATNRPLSEEDVAKMVELGWFQDELPEDAPYDPEEGWSVFT